MIVWRREECMNSTGRERGPCDWVELERHLRLCLSLCLCARTSSHVPTGRDDSASASASARGPPLTCLQGESHSRSQGTTDRSACAPRVCCSSANSLQGIGRDWPFHSIPSGREQTSRLLERLGALRLTSHSTVYTLYSYTLLEVSYILRRAACTLCMRLSVIRIRN